MTMTLTIPNSLEIQLDFFSFRGGKISFEDMYFKHDQPGLQRKNKTKSTNFSEAVHSQFPFAY